MKLVTLSQPESVAAEAYRTLRTNLYFATLEAPVRTIVVTSPAQAEGKSTVLANLAVVLAQADKKVIAVDADLRRPSLHELFDLHNERGLADLLAEDLGSQTPPLCQTNTPGLALLPAGTATTNPLDLLNSRRMETILSTMVGLADVVLLDAPPITMVSDAAILASHTDGVLLVVQIGKTRREQAQQAKDLLNRARARLLGAVMLNAPLDRAHTRY